MADLRGFVYALEPLKRMGEWNEERSNWSWLAFNESD